MSELDDLLRLLGATAPEERAAFVEAVQDKVAALWTANPGPQTLAYYSAADILLYGGQGGGGKTDLGLGLAFTAHQRSLLMRRKYANLDGLIDRAKAIHGSNQGFNGKPPPRLTTGDGRLIVFGANQHAGDEQGFQGQPYDFKYLDEATQFLESQVRFHIGWMRTTEPGQRVRMVLGTNPPIDSTGDWIVGFFRPWLDVTHPRPAKHGELRWYVTAPDGSDMEVTDGSPVILPGMRGEPLIPMSRTFIPAALKDNPYLINTGYQAKLDGLPEPIRSAVRDGNFMAARQDADFQVIPTQWVLDAQARWTEDGMLGQTMSAMAFDPAGGGADDAVLGWRYGGWFSAFEVRNGPETASGSHMAALVVQHRRDGAPVIVDVGGGYGGAVTERLKDNHIVASGFNGANKTAAISREGKLHFVNRRAEAWWRMREALDPDQEGGSPIALPPDPELRADLTAPTWELTTNGIKLESKDDLRERLGRSPGKGDVACMLLSEGNAAQKRAMRRGGAMPPVNVGYAHRKRR